MEYTCQHCVSSFQLPSDLLQHFLSAHMHTEQVKTSPYTCMYPQCGKVFISDGSLALHVRKEGHAVQGANSLDFGEKRSPDRSLSLG